jgi:1,4-dihydroxy-2-naphthoate octaprenyltransferase
VLGFIPGLLAVGILVVNNLRDYDTDRIVGKRTLVVTFGERFGGYEYLACVTIPALITASLGKLLGATAALATGAAFAVWGTILAARLMRLRGARLNPFLPATNTLLIAFSCAIAILLVYP